MFVNSKIEKNKSLYSLLLANLLVIFFAIYQSWSIFDVMFIYWFQSIIIGFFNIFRILGLENYSVKGFKENGRVPLANRATKIRVAIFFAFHYGIFHFVYLFFILSFQDNDSRSSLARQGIYILIGITLFFINHLISFRHNREELRSGLNIGTVMFRPYLRIVPMHLIIVFFGFVLENDNMNGFKYSLILFVFLVLKTVADILMHLSEHKKTIKIKK